jgi:large subunit ribosomal protein L17
MLANMANSLIMHKRIKTTTAKAKALRVYIEPLITKSKDDSTHSRRVVFGYLQNKEAVSELFREVSPKINDRPGGYTRILKTGTRLGDSAEMCIIELVDYNENLLEAKDTTAKSSRRRRRGGKKKEGDETSQTSATAESKVEVKEENIEVKSEESKTDETQESQEAKTEKVEKTANEVAEANEEKAEDEKQEAKAEETKGEVKDETSTDKKADEADDKKEEK